MKNIARKDALRAIENLNLRMIKEKLMQAKGWTQEQADIAEKWYKRFLILRVKYPDHNAVPNELIDSVWHQHILDTRKYTDDCAGIFGEFLHHRPSYDKGNAERLNAAFEQTNLYYRIEFGEDCAMVFPGKIAQTSEVSSTALCSCDGE